METLITAQVSGLRSSRPAYDACRKDGPPSLRDRAIMFLLFRLGLRAGDIAGMRPADIDWREATLLVRGKGRRDVHLPLPQDAGDAVLEYLEDARPQITIDRVFLCSNAPFRSLGSAACLQHCSGGTAGRRDRKPAIPRRQPHSAYCRHYDAPRGSHIRRDRNHLEAQVTRYDGALRQGRCRCPSTNRTAVAKRAKEGK